MASNETVTISTEEYERLKAEAVDGKHWQEIRAKSEMAFMVYRTPDGMWWLETDDYDIGMGLTIEELFRKEGLPDSEILMSGGNS